MIALTVETAQRLIGLSGRTMRSVEVSGTVDHPVIELNYDGGETLILFEDGSGNVVLRVTDSDFDDSGLDRDETT